MEILGYEINIYLVMVVIVGILVTTLILLIASQMGKRKPAGKTNRKIESKAENTTTLEKRKSQKAISIKQPEKSVRPQLIKPSSKSAEKDVTRKHVGETSDSLLENSSPQSPGDPSNKPAEKPSQQQPGYSSGETVDMSTAVGSSATEESKGGGTSSLLFDAGQVAKIKSEGEKTPEETKPPEETEESQEKKGGGSLMDIFEADDLEESEATALASLMTDVDLSTLSKLSEEMSQVLSKHKTGMTGRQ